VFRYFFKPWNRENLLAAIEQAMKMRNAELAKQKLIDGLIEQAEKLKAFQAALKK
jgi:hypothetical protein